MQTERFGDLLTRARAGDREAVDRLFGTVRADLQRRARRYATAEQPDISGSDLVQTVLLRAWENLGQFACDPDDVEALARFRGWVFRILDRQGMNEARARRAQRRRPPTPLVRLSPAGPDDPARGVEPAAQGATPSSVARGNETTDLIRQALERLPDDDRDMIERHDFDGLSLRQIAARRGVREDEVRRSYHRAIRRLEAELGGLA